MEGGREFRVEQGERWRGRESGAGMKSGREG